MTSTRFALGIMARAPVEGRCKTRLAAAFGPAGAAGLYRAMLLDTLDAFGRVGAARSTIVAAPEDDGPSLLRALAPPGWDVVAQRGADLGARLGGAFAALGAGMDAVALVDSDSPTVDTAPVAAALAQLRGPRRALMGPCDDGGYYLLAMTTFEPAVLEGIAWSTPRVAEQTRQRCRDLGIALDELPVGYDVDWPADVDRLRRELRAEPGRAPRVAAWMETA
jgi:rSAM/selenodomain-associated transferase 1